MVCTCYHQCFHEAHLVRAGTTIINFDVMVSAFMRFEVTGCALRAYIIGSGLEYYCSDYTVGSN